MLAASLCSARRTRRSRDTGERPTSARSLSGAWTDFLYVQTVISTVCSETGILRQGRRRSGRMSSQGVDSTILQRTTGRSSELRRSASSVRCGRSRRLDSLTTVSRASVQNSRLYLTSTRRCFRGMRQTRALASTPRNTHSSWQHITWVPRVWGLHP